MSADNSERRIQPDDKSRERRIIPRLSNATLRSSLSQIQVMMRVWVGFAIAYVVLEILAHLRNDALTRNKTLFFSLPIIVMVFLFVRTMKSIGSYLGNESQSRLVVVSDHLRDLFLVFILLTMVLGVAHLITVY